jgi:hypothetical protein
MEVSRDRHLSDDEGEACCDFWHDNYLIWFSVFSYISVITSLLSILANIRFIAHASWQGVPFSTVKATCIRTYASLFLLALCCIEFEVRYVLRKMRFLESWIIRGGTYAFLGIITGLYRQRIMRV